MTDISPIEACDLSGSPESKSTPNKYFVTVYYYRSESVIVQAETEDEAEDKAHELFMGPDTDVQDISVDTFSAAFHGDEEE